MSTHHHKRKERPLQSSRVWIEPELNEELDASMLSRAFLALALHRAGAEVAAEAEHESVHGDVDANA